MEKFSIAVPVFVAGVETLLQGILLHGIVLPEGARFSWIEQFLGSLLTSGTCYYLGRLRESVSVVVAGVVTVLIGIVFVILFDSATATVAWRLFVFDLCSPSVDIYNGSPRSNSPYIWSLLQHFLLMLTCNLGSTSSQSDATFSLLKYSVVIHTDSIYYNPGRSLRRVVLLKTGVEILFIGIMCRTIDDPLTRSYQQELLVWLTTGISYNRGRSYSQSVKKERALCELKMRNKEMMRKFALEVNGCCTEQVETFAEMVTVVEGHSSDLHGSHIIEEHLTASKRVEPRGMFKKNEIVFLMGLPGSGKSTYVHSLLREWDEGRLWEDTFDLVFVVNVRALLNVLATEPFAIERSLGALYPRFFKYIKFSDLRKYKSLIIVDSMDECDAKKICNAKDSSMVEMMVRSIIASPDHFKRIIVGNHDICKLVRNSLVKTVPCQFVEVTRFSENQLRNSVLTLCHPGRSDEVLRRILRNGTLNHMACRPVFTGIVCKVLSENSLTEIQSLTEFYVWAYAIFLTRHLNRSRPIVDTSSYANLFTDEIRMEALLKLSKMAFDMLSTGKKVFRIDEFFRNTETASGLVTPFLVRNKQFLCFSSLTFVDFFAAIHLFTNRFELSDQLLEQEYLGGVLPIWFELRRAHVAISDRARIVQDFLTPLINRLH